MKRIDKKLQVDIAEEGSLAVVSFLGGLYVENVPDTRRIIQEDTGEEVVHLVFDLSRCTYIDSSGIGMLSFFQQRARNRDGSLRLVVRQESPVRESIRVSGFHTWFLTFEELEDALRDYREWTSGGNGHDTPTTTGDLIQAILEWLDEKYPGSRSEILAKALARASAKRNQT